jgi:Domain of unknown function (DUF932)
MLTHSQVFKDQFMSIDDVRVKAPSCFTQTQSKTVSDKYTLIPTPDVLENLAMIGWLPIDAYEVTPKKAENIGYQKHFIKLRNQKHFIGSKKRIDAVPELLLINSYDAKCSFKFYISLYRVVSKSNMIVHSDKLLDDDGREKMKLPHKGDKLQSYLSLSESFDKNIQTVVGLLNNMATIKLDRQQQHLFAKECCRARWDYNYSLQSTKSLLDPWREEDDKDDLLTLSYRLHEKMIKGGWTGAGNRAIKPIKDPNRAFNIGARLFTVIENFYQQQNKISNGLPRQIRS